MKQSVKSAIKEWVPFIISAVVFLASLIFFLGTEPHAVIKGKGGWLIARGIAAVWSIIMAVGIYSNWIYFGKAIKEVYQDIIDSKKDVEGNPEVDAQDWVSAVGRQMPLLAWIATWFVVAQIMVSFFISEWCSNGF